MPQKQANKLIISEDGSHTIHSGQFDTSYHSTHGAIQESQHVFIDAGLNYWQSLNPTAQELRIFEMGLGTGLNAIMTAQHADTLQKNIHFTSIEKYPIAESIYSQLNYASLLHCAIELQEIVHTSPWDMDHKLTEQFTFNKRQQDLMDVTLDQTVDVIFYDAFGPRTQPELWNLEAVQKLESMMSPNAVLVTYCAQGAFRRNLISVGLEVSRIPGPPGKREMIRAIKSS